MTEDYFVVEFDKDITGKYLVKETRLGWFFPVNSKIEAEFLADKLNFQKKRSEQFYKKLNEVNCENRELKKEVALSKPLFSRRQLLGLLEEVRHELVSLDGLKAFDNKSERCVAAGTKKSKPTDRYGFNYEIVDKRYTIPFEEVIDLDYDELIEKIDKVLE